LTRRCGQSRAIQGILDDMAGRSLLEAMGYLRERSQFESEAPPD
jgi:hypothetical protein